MKVSGWGKYPKVNCQRLTVKQETQLEHIVNQNNHLIAFGNGRSYGDSALSDTIVDMKPRNHFIDFDETSGLLFLQAGVLLSEILEYFVPKGWFLKVTPGTKLITVGGAIASDVHGKNHHNAGCFSESVKEFSIMLANGALVNCSKETNPELFRATCGGQGLTGIIVDAKIYLKQIHSQYIKQTTIKTKNLKETFEAFEKNQNKTYSVAWIDCLAKRHNIGKSLLMVGDFAKDGNLNYCPSKQKNILFDFPTFTLNSLTVKLFNWLYYNKVLQQTSKQKVTIDRFFYPLDTIGHWNRIYGKKGFTQYQFILPKKNSFEGLQQILSTIAKSGKGSFLAVLKLYGPANDNWLSFPMEGYSLALDFKIEKGLFALLNRLDSIVVKYQGRLYLAKDARVSKVTFEKGYPHIEAFRQFRKDNQMTAKFQSLQSKRIEI